MRYKELKFQGNTYEKEYQINEILIKNNITWLIEAEIENARLEIIKNTLVWNAGTWFNGDWHYGVFRSGNWKAGIWQNGVWYNGLWNNGTFKSGIIFNGKFINGNIKGDVRGGEFIKCNIDKNSKISDNVKIFKKENNNLNLKISEPYDSDEKIYFELPYDYFNEIKNSLYKLAKYLKLNITQNKSNFKFNNKNKSFEVQIYYNSESSSIYLIDQYSDKYLIINELEDTLKFFFEI
jgi:hypothetical protein